MALRPARSRGGTFWRLRRIPCRVLNCWRRRPTRSAGKKTPLPDQLRQIFRRLRRSPLFASAALLTLALGIGANVAIFSVLDGVLLRPLPYPHSDQLVEVSFAAPGAGIPRLDMASANYLVYNAQSRDLRGVAMTMDSSLALTGHGRPEQLRDLTVTANTFQVLGVPPFLGRDFSPQDAEPGAAAPVILSYGLWRSKFGGNPAVIGQSLIADGKSRPIIGVMPRDFVFLDHPDIAIYEVARLEQPVYLGNFSWQGVGRLKPGVSLAAATADLDRLWPVVLRSYPPPPGFTLQQFLRARIAVQLQPLKREVVGDIGGTLWLLMGGIGLVLLIACANVANLMLARGEERRHELAIRAALGAGRGRLMADLALESLTLGALGGALGLALAWAGLRALVAAAPAGLPRLGQIGLNGAVLLFSLAAVAFVAILVAVAPAMKFTAAGVGDLKQSGRGLSDGRDRQRARRSLVGVQVALAFVLLVCSGLMIRSFIALANVSPGFSSAASLETARVQFPAMQGDNPRPLLLAEVALKDKLAALPGVSSVALATKVPMEYGWDWHDLVFAADRRYPNGQLPPMRRFIQVSPEYFQTLGIPLVAGRDFTWTDIFNTTPVALISAKFAREYWGSPANALGRQIRSSSTDTWKQIIGVVGDVRYDGLDQPAPASVYWPLATRHLDGAPVSINPIPAFILRTRRAGTAPLLREIRAAAAAVAPGAPVFLAFPESHFLDQSLSRTTFTLVMLGIAGGMALLLGLVGLYAVLAYAVTRRRREIGIRLALGAEPRSVLRMIVRQGLLLAGLGMAVGAALAAIAARLMRSLLFGVRPFDPATFLAVAAALLLAALLASWLPALRAARVNPIEALRAE